MAAEAVDLVEGKLAFGVEDAESFAAAGASALVPGLASLAGSSSFVVPAKPVGLGLAPEPVV